MSATEPDEVTKIFRAEKAKDKKADSRVLKDSQPPLRATAKRWPHSSYWVFRILGPEAQGGEGFKRVAPGLRPPKQNEGMILLALVVLSAVISSFGGIAIYSATHPPIQLIGVCQAPAIVRNGDCVLAETGKDQSGNPTTVYVPSGIVYFLNGTLYRGRP